MLRTIGLNRNLAAFLDMPAYSEGTDKYGEDDGYNVVVADSLFDSYADHPRKRIKINAKLYSTERWTSLPGARYGQHENTSASLNQTYSDAGGIFTHV